MSPKTMRNSKFGMRNRRLHVHSAFHIPHFALLLLILTACSRDSRTPLVIYSPHGRDLLTLFEHRFEALHPDIDVRWLDMGSQDVYDRLRSERANPQADVWFGGPSLILAQAAHDSLLDCRRPVWADAIAPLGRGAGDCYFAAYETPAVFLYAEKVVSPAEAHSGPITRTAAAASSSVRSSSASRQGWKELCERETCGRALRLDNIVIMASSM